METEVSLELLESLLEGDDTKHLAERWMDILEDQLAKFTGLRETLDDSDDSDDDAVPKDEFKNFAGLGHLIWWTLSSVKAFNDDDPEYLSKNVFVPWHKAIDDFLCITDDSRPHDRLLELLRIIEGEMQNFGTFGETEPQVLRADVVDYIESLGVSHIVAEDLERGCYLYAGMVALIDCLTTEEADEKWREMYGEKNFFLTNF